MSEITNGQLLFLCFFGAIGITWSAHKITDFMIELIKKAKNKYVNINYNKGYREGYLKAYEKTSKYMTNNNVLVNIHAYQTFLELNKYLKETEE